MCFVDNEDITLIERIVCPRSLSLTMNGAMALVAQHTSFNETTTINIKKLGQPLPFYCSGDLFVHVTWFQQEHDSNTQAISTSLIS